MTNRLKEMGTNEETKYVYDSMKDMMNDIDLLQNGGTVMKERITIDLDSYEAVLYRTLRMMCDSDKRALLLVRIFNAGLIKNHRIVSEAFAKTLLFTLLADEANGLIPEGSALQESKDIISDLIEGMCREIGEK